MKAIVIAAGLGSRLKELTHDRPKSKVVVAGKPLIEHQLEAFRQAGITDVSIVTGYLGEQLEGYPGVKTYRNDRFRENNILYSLMYAREELNDDVVVCYSDIIYRKALIRELVNAPAADFTLVVDRDWQKAYVGRTQHPTDQAEKVRIEDGLVTRLGKVLHDSDASAEFIGVMRLSKKGAATFARLFDEISVDRKGKPFQAAAVVEKSYVTDLLQELADRGQALHTLPIQGGWREIDTYEDFLAADKEFTA